METLKKDLGRFVSEYQQKIENTETLIDAIEIDLRSTDSQKPIHQERLKTERAALFAKRQCYLQSMKDFQSILDLHFDEDELNN